MAQGEWPMAIAQTIATEVRRHRKRLGMSAQDLADTCAELGYPIARQVLANLENGRREAVTVAELFILGRALKTAPLLLAFPVGREPSAEPTPGMERDTWASLRWASGQVPFPEPPDREKFLPTHDRAAEDEWIAGCLPLHDYGREDRAVREWLGHRARGLDYKRQALDPAAPEENRTQLLDQAEEEFAFADEVRTDILKLRAAMRKDGITLRPLPAMLGITDEEKSE
jgi:transcriptional regulator with XRE-family HTH domain